MDILLQTTYMVIYPIMVGKASFFNCTTAPD